MPEKKAEKAAEALTETAFRHENVIDWFKRLGWSRSPFTFSIIPSLFVGYKEQLERANVLIKEGHKLFLIVGPTGSGKTSMLKWIGGHLSGKFDYIYIGKPPEKPEDFVLIFNDKFKNPWYLRIFRPFISNIKSLYQVPSFLNKKLKNKRLVVLFDEAHEASLDVLEWLRVLSDQVDNMCVIASGLPVIDEKLNELETFRKRIAAKIELLSLTKEETLEMIKKRIENAGGSGIEPFDMQVIDIIYDRTGGFPREILKVCDDLVNRAANLGRSKITQELLMLDIREKPKTISLDLIEKMTPMQKEIVEMLGRKASTPGDIANMIDLKKYKSRQHAVRSINNILKVLMQDGFVERKRSDKAFVYQLSPRIKTLVVKS
jgi:type II secretory pathway predicted ATPase ExeA